MKKNTFLIGLVLFLFVLHPAMAQRVITGTVKSTEGYFGLPGVTIMAKGTVVGTATDSEGKYMLNIPKGVDFLEFTCVGYQKVEMPVNNDVIDVAMSPEASDLEEVVITGYGVNRKSAFTGSATTVGSKELSGRFSANPIKALEGNVAGMQITSGSGQPGAPATIFIRGRNSLNSGTQPLYIIDGVPFETGTQGMRSSEGAQLSPLSTINPDDIESVITLKDATATSIYGARAANGVIVITTKKGKQGVFNVNFSARTGFEAMPMVSRAYGRLNAAQYQELTTEAFMNDYNLLGDKSGIHNRNMRWFGGRFEYTNESLSGFLPAYISAATGLDTSEFQDVNWLNEVTRQGIIQQYNVEVQSGGIGKYAMKYFMSIDYMDNQAIVVGKDMNRIGLRLNLDQSPSDIITYGFNSNFSYSEVNMGGGGGYFSDPITQAYMQNPLCGPYDSLGNFNFKTLNGYNPVAQRSELGDKSLANQNRIMFSPHLRVNITPNIFFVSRVGLDYYSVDEYGYWSFLQPQGKDMRGLGEKQFNNMTTLSVTNTLNYINTYDEKHNVNFLIGQEGQSRVNKTSYMSASNFSVDYLNELSLASVAGQTNSYRYDLYLQSYFSNAQYDFDNKYYLSGSFRVDGSSRFGENNYWGKFWSVGAKYRISEEEFMQGTKDWLSTLMVRSSYGTTGNQEVGSGWYAARNLFGFGAAYNQRPGSYHSQFGNPDLAWEYTAKFNVGLDLTLFNRFYITADYYKHNTKDMVFNVPVSRVTGLSSYYKNIGELSNEGIEVSLNVDVLNKEDFRWNVNLIGSHNVNKIVQLSTDEPIKGNTTIIAPGYDIYTFYMPEWAGVNPDNGRGMWYEGEEGTVTTENYNKAGKRIVGSASPKFQGSFNNYLSWKGIDFSFQLTTSLGGKIYGNNLRYDEQLGGTLAGNFTGYVYDNRWRQPGDQALVPQLLAFDGGKFRENNHSSRFLMSGDYLKIRTISLGYTLPTDLVSSIYFKTIRISLNAENVHTFAAADYRGFDPSGINADGVQWWNYPIPRTFTAGVTFGF